MQYDPKRVAGELRAIRARKRVSQEEPATAAGISVPTLIRCEADQGGFQLETAWKLADYYDVTLDELVGRKED